MVGDTNGKLYVYKNDDSKPWTMRSCQGMVSFWQNVKWLGLLVWVLDCLGTWRPERSGSKNWIWCLSCGNERPCVCLQPALWLEMTSTEWTQELCFYIDPVPVHCAFCSRALGCCVADVFGYAIVSLKKLLKRLFMRRGGGGAGVYLKVLPCIAFSHGWTLKAFFSLAAHMRWCGRRMQ